MGHEFRYRALGPRWFKGNTHIHSTKSDGGRDFREIERMYASAGYDFLFRTDHWVASSAYREKRKAPLMWMDGIELDGDDGMGGSYHIVGLGVFRGVDPSKGLAAGVAEVRRQGGMLILAHPLWMGNTEAEVLRWNFDAVEVYNHVCHWLNGKGCGLSHWHAALSHRPDTLGLAVDDAHISTAHPGWNGGWIVVNAPELSRRSIMNAIRRGRFYSSHGPDFLDIRQNNGAVEVTTSPVRFVRLVGPKWQGRRVGSFKGRLVTGASFVVPPDWAFAYVEIEDAKGRRAWTNTLTTS
jgi:hypothetical protein